MCLISVVYLIVLVMMFEIIRKILIPLSIYSLAMLGGCAYKIDVQQGNTFDRDDFATLRVGMTQRQVMFLLGTPMIKDPFYTDRWDYVYSFQPGGGELRTQHLTLFFDGDTLTKIDDTAVDESTLPNPVR